MDFTVTQTVTREQVANLLCSAFEGGSNYWYRIAQCLAPTTWEFEDDPPPGKHYAHTYPLNPGGEVLIVDEEGDDDGVLTLDAKALQKGLQTMIMDYPQHFANILAENADAETGDVFLQCCLFGEIIYG